VPLTAKGQEIMAQMKKEYGEEKGEEVFYAAKNAGTISGVDTDEVVEEKKEEKKVGDSLSLNEKQKKFWRR
jgi:hypothetical protein